VGVLLSCLFSKIVSKRGRTGADSEIFRSTQESGTGQTLSTAQPISPGSRCRRRHLRINSLQIAQKTGHNRLPQSTANGLWQQLRAKLPQNRSRLAVSGARRGSRHCWNSAKSTFILLYARGQSRASLEHCK
jgi:hypothetical protein